MNRINQLFNSNKKDLLSIYFCAGDPTLDGTADVIRTLEKHGVSMIEVGIPFSDPMADGIVIQNAATQALRNGMSLKVLFEQLRNIRRDVKKFTKGIVLFGLGQLCNIAAQLQLAAFHWSAAAALAGLLTLAIALKGIGQWNTSANDPWLTIYTVLVATTAAKSLSTAIVLTGTTGGILLGAGGLLFFLSDMVLGIWNYQKPHILLADLNWLLYFAGQFMLCAGYIAAVR